MYRYPMLFAVSMLACAALPLSSVRAAGLPANIAAAVADGNRPEADRQRDADRKPGETLEFADVKSGQSVGELIPGGGYFTRLFSKAVGAGGHVYAFVPQRPGNPPADAPDIGAKVKAIAADPNYANVAVIEQPLASTAPPQPLDLFFTAQNYHDLHNIPNLDVAAFNKGVFDGLKPGGLYVIVDHSAPDGTGTSVTSTLHRIDAAAVKKEVTAAGFKFAGSSMVLANADDPRTAKSSDPSIRGKTDQFILKFRKPKK